ncbi:MAG: glutamate synthase [Spirochaetia bacterium]|nr:glutamate synthase [Spirochaetia bacterium]
MQKITVNHMSFKQLNSLIRDESENTFELDEVHGQRFIAAGMQNKNITISGIPGNALGACLEKSSRIFVKNDCQDATGDTMNDGEIIICGNCGDTAGYSMRGGKIFIKESAGYRAGIHMKEYKDEKPVLVIGDRAGSFLGEYLAGGLIIVLGLNQKGKCPVGNFCGTGMHGGQIFLRTDELPKDLPKQVVYRKATKKDLLSIKTVINQFCKEFSFDKDDIFKANFYVLEPNSTLPYKQHYTAI